MYRPAPKRIRSLRLSGILCVALLAEPFLSAFAAEFRGSPDMAMSQNSAIKSFENFFDAVQPDLLRLTPAFSCLMAVTKANLSGQRMDLASHVLRDAAQRFLESRVPFSAEARAEKLAVFNHPLVWMRLNEAQKLRIGNEYASLSDERRKGIEAKISRLEREINDAWILKDEVVPPGDPVDAADYEVTRHEEMDLQPPARDPGPSEAHLQKLSVDHAPYKVAGTFQAVFYHGVRKHEIESMLRDFGIGGTDPTYRLLFEGGEEAFDDVIDGTENQLTVDVRVADSELVENAGEPILAFLSLLEHKIERLIVNAVTAQRIPWLRASNPKKS